MSVVRQIVEKICVIITIILVYENALVFYQHLFPYWWKYDFRRFWFHLIVGHWLLINTVGHYYLGITTYPGFVMDLKNEEQSNYTICSKCQVMRPPRAHHCKVCQKCVLRYDHHCPWINNCVGYRNHVHFFLFCIYMAMISGYATLVGQQQFQLVLFHDEILFGLFDPLFRSDELTIQIIEHHSIGPLTGFLTMFLFIINLVAMGLVLALTIWQASLISKGQTCVEEKIQKSVTKSSNSQKRPFDLGWKQNWKLFFEIDTPKQLIVRLLIPFPFQPKHDGTRWPSNHSD